MSQYITQIVDDLISKGRIQSSMRDQYVNLMTASPDLAQEFEGMFLRGQDYTNKTKSLSDYRKQQEAALKQSQDQLAMERRKLEQWQTEAQAEINGYRNMATELADWKAKSAAYEQTLKDYQILDQVSVPKSSSVPVNTMNNNNPYYNPQSQYAQSPQTTPTSQTTSYLTRDDAAGAIRELTMLQGKMSKIQARHMKLFGEPLDDDLVSHFLETGEDPEKHWEVKYNVQQKQQDIANKNKEAEIARIREEVRSQVISELSLDPTRITGGPLGRPKGALNPVLENFSHSRAMEHSQNHANDNAAAPNRNEFVPPEQRSIVAASRERVAAAANMWNKHFDDTGRPNNTPEGKAMFNKHFVSDEG